MAEVLRRIRQGTAAIAATGFIGAALAMAPATAPQLSLAEIVTLLEASGYTGIDEIEREKDHWEAEATAPGGRRVELKLDPVDGRVVEEKPED